MTRRAPKNPADAPRLPLAAHVPRHRLPAILDALRLAGEQFETGEPNHDHRTLEVRTTYVGGYELERHGIAVTRARVRTRWPAPGDGPVPGSLSRLPGPAIDDPLEMAFRLAADEARARTTEGSS